MSIALILLILNLNFSDLNIDIQRMAYLNRMKIEQQMFGYLDEIEARKFENKYGEPFLIRATCYYGGVICKSGAKPRHGIIAMNNEHLGKTAILYTKDMELIGVYEFLDTGKNVRLKNGTAIDVWQPTLDDYNDWVRRYGDYVNIQIIDGEG